MSDHLPSPITDHTSSTPPVPQQAATYSSPTPLQHGAMPTGTAPAFTPTNGVAIDTARGYVGFWARFAAAAIDAVIMAIPCFLLSPTFLGPIIVYWLYSALMHSSKRQATWGRSAMGIVMTDDHGNRVTFGKATGQYFGTLVSGFIVGIGYLMIAFTGKKQGLHDMMAGTLHYYRAR